MNNLNNSNNNTGDNNNFINYISILQNIQNDAKWINEYLFQPSIVKIAYDRLYKRLLSWMKHHSVTNQKEEIQAWLKFEKKHFQAYNRWNKIVFQNSWFQERIGKLDPPKSQIEHVERLFLFYIIYGEIHEFRNLKSVFFLFYHTALYFILYPSPENFKIGEWVRKQGMNLYKLLALVYDKDEMNQECFHHDDLDDIFSSPKFVKKFWKEPEKDFLTVFELKNSTNKYPKLYKLLSLSKKDFILYWMKSVQNRLDDEKRKEREIWLRQNFFELLENKEERKNIKDLKIKEMNEKLLEIDSFLLEQKSKLESAIKEYENSKKQYLETLNEDHSPNSKIHKSDHVDLIEFMAGQRELNTAKELFNTAKKYQKEANEIFQETKVKLFRSKKESIETYKISQEYFKKSIYGFEHSIESFSIAINTFQRAKSKKYKLESEFFKNKSLVEKLKSEELLAKLENTRLLEFTFEDSINEERYKFAKQFKTFKEKAGGWLGLKGYLTIFYNYTSVIYLHLFLLFPLSWFYFDYQSYITISNIGGSFSKLTSLNTLMSPSVNILLMAGLTIGLILLCCIIVHLCLRWRVKGKQSTPRRDFKTKSSFHFKEKILNFFLWIMIIITEIILMKYLVLDPLKIATSELFLGFDIRSFILILAHWIPVIILYFTSLQFVFIVWVGIFGWFFGYKNKIIKVKTWGDLNKWFDRKIIEKDELESINFKNNNKEIVVEIENNPNFSENLLIPKIVEKFYKNIFSKEQRKKNPLDNKRKLIAFARVWNSIIDYYYEIHKLTKEEWQTFSYKIIENHSDFLDAKITKHPELKQEPLVKEVKEHLIKFVNNICLKKPTLNIEIEKMFPITILTPVGSEKIIYSFDFITQLDNTQHSFLQHLINMQKIEWENFKQKELEELNCETLKFFQELEKNILSGIPIQSPIINSSKEIEILKNKLCEWASLRFQALYRTIHGFMQIPKALEILARIQNPLLTPQETHKLIKEKFSFIIGYQSLSEYQRFRFPVIALKDFKSDDMGCFNFQEGDTIYILSEINDSKNFKWIAEHAKTGKCGYLLSYIHSEDETKNKHPNQAIVESEILVRQKKESEMTEYEIEARNTISNIEYIKKKFPDVKFVYSDYDIFQNNYYGKLISGYKKNDIQFELFGPVIDMGLGKPTNQNLLSHFIDGMIVQTIDVNQDNNFAQSFFIPNALAEFDKDKKVKIVGFPEYVFTRHWSSTAWCSAFSERSFGTLVQRCYSKLGIRLHYGHPDYLDALWIMTETGLSKMPYVSEDIFTGFDTIIKGGKIIHIEYQEVGKARDVDLFTTTKFIRKISMGASQMACSRYMYLIQTCSHVSFFQKLSLYYSTVGFYLNHALMYVSVWFALVCQIILIIIQRLFATGISYYIANRVYTFEVGFALVAPGVFQLILEYGLLKGLWSYISHFLMLSVYATFHILNISNYWQYGLTNSAFYLASEILKSGRGAGLEHIFLKDLNDTFYSTHWRAGFFILWMGIIALIFSGDFIVFFVMYFLPAGIWLWGAMFLNPGSLPNTVHEEQWKRLLNQDMKQVHEIIQNHINIDSYQSITTNSKIKKFFIKVGRNISYIFKAFYWIYTVINFSIHTRVVRFISLIVLFWNYVISETIPVFTFTNEYINQIDNNKNLKETFYEKDGKINKINSFKMKRKNLKILSLNYNQ